MGAGGGIFQLDLTLAKSASRSSSAIGIVNIVPAYAINGINSMTLNLEDSLIYFAPGSSNLASISLGKKLIANYTHGSFILDARSMASYNEYLAIPSTLDIVFGVFVRIRPPDSNAQLLLSSGGDAAITNHMYMIREEFQPLPGMYVCTHVLYMYIFLCYVNFEDVTNPVFSQFDFEGLQRFRFCEYYLSACCTCDIANGITLYFKQHLIKKSTFDVFRNQSILLLFSPIFLSGNSFILTYYAQYFAQSFNVLLKGVASYLIVISYTLHT